MKKIMAILTITIVSCSNPAEPKDNIPSIEVLQRKFDLLERDIRDAWRKGDRFAIWMIMLPDSVPSFVVKPL